jgi:hypothetical protein
MRDGRREYSTEVLAAAVKQRSVRFYSFSHGWAAPGNC